MSDFLIVITTVDSQEVIAFGIDAGRAEYLEWITRVTR